MSNEMYGFVFPDGTEVRVDDSIRITGYASSPNKAFVNLLGTVATVSNTEEGNFIKVWPEEGQEQLPDEEKIYGKIWFPCDCVVSVEVVSKGFLWDAE
jgi:hypothetical protein